MPRPASSSIILMTRSVLCISMLSVISSSSHCGARPWASSTRSTRSGSAGEKSRAERLTAILIAGRPASCQARAWRTAASITQALTWTMSPDSSATGTNSPGGIMPFSGCCQRTSASAPTMRPLAMSTLGWKCSSSSSRSMAWRRLFSILR